MSDDELEEIRKQKREELKEQETGGGATPTEPVHVEGADHLREVVNAHDTVLVDFYADWCGPCKMLEPTIAGLAAESPAAVAKVDVDAHGDLAAQYNVQGVPTLVLFSGGEAVEQVTGVRDRQALDAMVGQYT